MRLRQSGVDDVRTTRSSPTDATPSPQRSEHGARRELYVARYREMRPPATHVWLEPFDQVEDAEAMVNTRYQQLAADHPATISSGTRSSDRIRMGSLFTTVVTTVKRVVA